MVELVLLKNKNSWPHTWVLEYWRLSAQYSVLSWLLIHPSFTSGSFKISTLVQTVEKGEKLKGLGVQPVGGLYVLERELGDVDVVFLWWKNVGFHSHPWIWETDCEFQGRCRCIAWCESYSWGLKKRYERTSGRVLKLIYTVSRFPFILWLIVADP